MATGPSFPHQGANSWRFAANVFVGIAVSWLISRLWSLPETSDPSEPSATDETGPAAPGRAVRQGNQGRGA